MGDCIFCKIINGDVPSYKIYENEHTFAFLDIAKDVDAHILVVPKKHCKNLLDCDNDTLCEVIKTVKLVSNHLVENCDYQGVNVLNASDECAGQSVGHLHFHIIARRRDDGIDAWPKFEGAKRSLEEIWQEIAIK